MGKIHIVYLISTLRACGPTNVLYNIIQYVDKEKFDISVITLSKEENNSRKNDFYQAGVKIYPLNLSRIKMHFCGGKLLRAILEKVKPDILHAHGFRADLYIVKYAKEYTTCTTIHNYPHIDYVMTYGNLVGNYLTKKNFQNMKMIKHLIACSKSLSEALWEHNRIKTDFIRNGIDIAHFSQIDVLGKRALKRRLGIPDGKKIILSVGVLSNLKNPQFILDAFTTSVIRNECILIFLGDGPLRGNFLKRYNDNILFLGNVSNVNEYLAVTDFFVSASKSEGMPNSVLEAMASGVPVFLSDIQPHREILELNQESGKLFSLKNTQGLTELFNHIYEYCIEEMSSNARETVEKYLSAQKMSVQYQEKYLDIIKKI